MASITALVTATTLALTCLIPSLGWAGDGLRVFYTYEHEKLGKILQEFGANTNIAIRPEFRAQHDLKPELLAMELAELPDAIIMPADHVGIHHYVKYSPVEPSLFAAKLPERVWGSALSDGHFYGVPLIQGNHLMLYYNKGLIAEPARDWQVMAAQKAELEAKGLIAIAWNYNEPYYFLPFLGAFGGWPLSDGKVELNTPAMVNALEFYYKIKDLRLQDCLSACARTLFKTGKLAYMISGVWDGIGFHQALGDNLGLAPIPAAGDKKIRPPFSTHLIAFPNNSLTGKQRAALIQLVNYLQSPAIQRRLWDQTGAIPVELGAFDYAQQNAKGYLKQALALMVDTKAVPADQSMSVLWDALGRGLTRHRTGLADAPAAAAYMQSLAERHVRSIKRLSEQDEHIKAQMQKNAE